MEKVQLFYHKFSIVATAIATIVMIIELILKCFKQLSVQGQLFHSHILLKIISTKGMKRK